MLAEAPRLAWSSTSLHDDTLVDARPDEETCFAARGMSTQDLLMLRPALAQRAALTSIDLNGNNLWDRGAQAVADAIRACQRLTEVNVSSNSIGATGMRHTSYRARILMIVSFHAYVTGISCIADAIPSSKSLRRLVVRSNRGGNIGAEAIARALRTQSRYKHAPGSQHTGIEAIDLSANFLRSEVGCCCVRLQLSLEA